MNDGARVALIYPYFRTRSSNELLFPPLGAAVLASQLLRIGINARIFDCTFTTLDILTDSLKAYGPDIIGIYSMITLTKSTFRIAKMARTYFPDCLLVAGGPLPTLYPENYLGQFDAVFRGEADKSFPCFCRDFFDKGAGRKRLDVLPLAHYAGLYVRQGAVRVDNPPIHFNEKDIGDFPIPLRIDFNHARYHEEWIRNGEPKTASIITTLGCPFKCDFCSKPVFGDLFRRKNLDHVFDDIRQIKRLGYESLWIADDNFTLDPDFLGEFCKRIEDRGLSWSCLSRVTGLDLKTVRMMKSAGCRRVFLGLETGSSVTLKLMNKNASLENGMKAVNMFHDEGVEVAAFFIVGYPDETLASIEETFSLALTLPLDMISFNVPFPLPGSKLFERVSGLDKNLDWNSENEVTFVFNSEFDQDWLRGRVESTMEEFMDKKARSSAVSHGSGAILKVERAHR
jgi:anaerobic magnesium-protoporphyrin IX monomethyl ester cyclase